MFAKKNRSWWRVGVFAGLAALGMEGAAVPVVSNVKMRQLEGTKTVEITYDLADSNNIFLDVSVSVTTNGVALPVETVSGDVYDVAPGKGKRILWEAGKDWGGQYTEIAKARVRAEGASESDFLVIDLSDGVNAVKYPVNYLDAVPSSGWTDEYKTNKLVLRRIHDGTFMMGSPESEYGSFGDEPRHTVTLTKAFYIGVFEVTQRQWELVMGTRPSRYSNASYYKTRPVEQVSFNMIRGSSLGAKWPVTSEVDATSFIGKIRAKTGLNDFDLPTEAQWEYACRAGTITAFNNGKNLTDKNQDSNLNTLGRYWYNGGSDSTVSSTPSRGTALVGSYTPNAWGLYDMHGNVNEWCLDWYSSLDTSAVVDPVGPISGSQRINRGGGCYANADGCRSATRNHPYSSSSSGCYLGFRLARAQR